MPEDGSQSGPGRRPADVWVGAWHLLRPAAFDLAVTSGMRLGVVARSAADGQLAASEYEARKCSHQQALATCTAEGLQFIPLVVEACGGGWAPTAMKTWKGITLQRENARAVLRRLA